MAGSQRKSVNKKKIMPVKTTHVVNIDYKDVATLKGFISERSKIRARRVTGLSVQDQRKIALVVKNAREAALLPYASTARRSEEEQMKLILTSTVDKLGIAGDAAEVRNGYGHNYLAPQGKAVVWSCGVEKQIEGIKRVCDAREAHGVEYAQELRTQIEESTVKVPACVAELGPLFGAVTAADLALAVKKAGGPAIDKWSVSFVKPAKTVGDHVVSVKLHPAVTARVGFEAIPV